MKKTIYIIHGWGFDSKSYWIPNLKFELEKQDCNVVAIDMPDTENPTIANWVTKLQEVTDNHIDENVYFVAHSIGCQTVLRFLESLPDNQKLGGALFVAGWLTITGLDESEKTIAEPWLTTPIDYERIKQHTDNISCIFSNNDPYVTKDNEDIFLEKLDVQIFQIGDRGHIDNESDSEFILDAFNESF
jgi:hypothetical protein